MRLTPGTRLGRYEIRSLLGIGGMGEVYLAHDTTLHRAVAIKLLPGHLASDTDRLQRLEQEAYAASSLNHPNILTIHEVGTHDGTHFIATEFVDGESLRHRLTHARLELREVLDIGAQIASALGAAHAAGIVHRDVKPENIMLRKDGIVKVLDFGLAKVAGGQAWDSEGATIAAPDTEPGTVLGTVQYMSPEQARGLETDARTDIWSFGVVLYEMLAGRSTFEGRTSSDVIAAILRTEPPPLARYVDDAPPELDRIVTKALQKDPEERYQAVKDLGLDLKGLKRRLEFDTQAARTIPSTPLTPASAAPRRTLSRAALVMLIAGAVAVVALGYGAYSGYLGGTGKGNIDSIAVLPFANQSGNPDNEYLSDGISETLINSLSELTGLKVIARTSSFNYKGKQINPREVAKALGVEAIVTGRLGQRGETLLISAELIDARDDTQMWGDRYNRNAADLLAVQADISREIAEKLRRRLSSGERDRVTKPETANRQAYELALQGRFYASKGGTQNQKKAIEYFQQAVGIDPNYALAYVRLSNNYRSLVFNSVLDPKEYMPKVEAAVRKALELDDTLAEAHVALGNFLRESWEWAGAEREYQRAIALNPNLATARRDYGAFLSSMGRHDQAIAEVTRGRELDPLSRFVTTQIGYRLFFARRYDEAIDRLKPELHQGLTLTPLVLGYIYAATGKYKEAMAAYQVAIDRGDDTPSTQIYLGAAYARAGDRQRAQAILKRLESGERYVSPGELPVLYIALGQREQAFRSWEKAFAARDLQLQFLGIDPSFDSVRDDPRFADLMRRVGLPSAPTESRNR
jgi:serine/threonine protein kinase/tetratricopeptide (TPR) repeat protein